MKEKSKLSTKLLAFIMALFMLLVSLPVSAFASAISASSSDDASTSINAESETVKKDVIVLEEDEALRDENIKHFKLSDGTTKAVVYSQAVHYKDADGNWVDIDNALTLNGSEYSSNNKQSIKFANKSGSNGLVSIKDGDYKIDFTPLNTNKVSVVIENPQSNNSRKFEDMSVLNNLVSKAIYADIYDGVDIEYILVGNNIKENIIVKEKQDSYTFSFELKLNKLSAELVEGAIILSDYDSREQVYEIPVPYMFDANNVYSDSVEYSLVQNNKWKYTFTVTADAEWINSDDRVFPVTVDPALGVVDSDIVAVTSWEKELIQEGACLPVGAGFETYVKFLTLPSLPNSAYITDAEINMYHQFSTDAYVGAYQILTDWNENYISKLKYSNEPLDYNYIVDSDPYTETDNLRYSWNIVDLVRSWYNGENNYGIAFNTVYDVENAIYFGSMLFGAEYGEPRFSVTYRDMKGVESYWTSISQSVGRAGNGYVNLATGNLMFEIPTLTTTDSIFSYTPSMIYNSALAGEDYEYSQTQSGYWFTYTAKGFKLNMNETLIKQSYVKSDGSTDYYYVWTDSDGTEHYFFKSTNANETNIYYDEDGLQLKLELGFIDENEKSYCKIVDSGFNERIFYILNGAPESEGVEVWYLTQIRDRSGNALRFYFDGANRPNDIKLNPSGTTETTVMISPLYLSNGKLALMWCKATGEGILFRHSDTPTGELSSNGGTYLREALYVKCDSSKSWPDLLEFVGEFDNEADGITVNAVIQYGYDSAGNLIYVKDTLSGYGVYYTYDNDKVICIEELGKNNELGQTIIIDYYSGYTEVLTSGADDEIATDDDIINVYTFDKEGRVVSTYSTNLARTEIYGATVGEYENSNENAKNNIKIATSTGAVSPNYLLNGNFELSHNGYTYWNKTTTGSASVSFPSYTVDSIGWDNSYIDLKVKQNGEAAITQNVTLAPGNYTLSLKLDSSIATDAKLKLKVTALDGTVEFVENVALDKASSDTEETTIDKFAYLSFEIEGEYNTSKEYKVGVYLSGTTNTSSSIYEIVTIDNLMLAKSTGMQNYSWLNNGSFDQEYASDSSGIGYWITNENSQIVANDENSTSAQFYNSLKIEGSIGTEREVKQIIYKCTDEAKNYNFENGPAFGTVLEEDQVYIISGFAKAPEAMSSDNSIFALKVEATYYCYGAENTHVYYYDFNANVDDWQYITGTFIIPDTQMLSQLTVSCVYSNNYGEAYFDNIAIRPSDNESPETTQYYYYDNGKLRAQKFGWEVAYYAYDDNGNTTDVISNKQRTIYTYENNLVVKEEYYKHEALISCEDDYDTVVSGLTNSYVKSVVNYEYNAYGQIVKQTVYDPTKSTFFETENTYDVKLGSKIFGALTKTETSLGEITRYFFDSNSGKLLANIQSDGTGTYYTYDALGNLTFVQPAVYLSSTAQKVQNSENVQYVYNSNDLLEKIIVNGTEYKFTYDAFGNQDSVSIGDNQLMRVETDDYNGKITKEIYANGLEISYEYDDLSRIVKVTYNNPTDSEFDEYVYEYEYDSNGNLSKFVDGKNGKSIIYRYDHLNRLVQFIEYNNNELLNVFSANYIYSQYQNLDTIKYSQNYVYGSSNESDLEIKYRYRYNFDDGSFWQIWMDIESQLDFKLSCSYDSLSRYSNKTITNGAFNDPYVVKNVINYGYVDASSIVNEYKSTIKINDEDKDIETFKYVYDKGYSNIIAITDAEGNVLREYTYDNLDRLRFEEDYESNTRTEYEYDNNGNILTETIKIFANDSWSELKETIVKQYTYSNANWADQLTSYDGKEIIYDVMGNPVKIRENDEDIVLLNWEDSGSLSSITFKNREKNKNISYTYNDGGIRTSKTIDGTTHIYSLDGTMIVSEKYDDVLILYLYDEAGAPIGLAYRKSSYGEKVFDKYLFTKNLQGDIIGIYSEDGTCVAEYSYDAWGNHTVTNHTSDNIGDINPFRYRGYYFDAETDLYYLSSRYYNSEIKRFISPDSIGTLANTPMSLTDKNLYVYCDNNPIMRVDNGGQFWDTIFDVVSLAFSIVDVCRNPDDPWAWVGLAADAVDLIPFVTGVGEVTRAVNTTRKIAKNADEVISAGADIARLVDNAGDLGKVGKNYEKAIDTYTDLKKISAGSGNEVHHIIEKRFAKNNDILGNTNNMQSIILTKQDHAVFTKAWRAECPYGRTYSPNEIYEAAKKVYADYPTLLNSVRKSLNIN